MKFRNLVGAVASVALFASAAAAQVCQGDLSFRGRPTHIVGGLGITDRTTSLAGGLAFGHAQGLFGGASLGMRDYDYLGGSAITLGGGIGYSMPLQRRSRWQLCPGATLTFGFGPSQDIGATSIRYSSQTFIAGASVGTANALNRSVTLLPYGSAAIGHTRLSADGVSASDTYLLLGFGAGIQFSPSFVLKPSLGLALGAEDGNDDVFFGIGATFALPQGRSR